MSKRIFAKRELRTIIVVVFIIYLGIMLAVNLCELRKDVYYHSYTYTYEVSSMELALRDNNYPKLLEMVKVNTCKQAEPLYDTTEYDAIAHYYEAATYYYLYAQSGNTEQAKKYGTKMAEYEAKLTSERFIKLAQEIKLKFTPGMN